MGLVGPRAPALKGRKKPPCPLLSPFLSWPAHCIVNPRVAPWARVLRPCRGATWGLALSLTFLP